MLRKFMWSDYPPRKIPIHRRVWFLTLVTLCVLAAIAGGVFWIKIKIEYEAKAAQFNMTKLAEMESASIILDRNKNVLGRIFLENRDEVTIDQIPYTLTQAVLAAEDSRFFQHHGVDYYGMFRAALKNWRAGRIRQGASTLTQQLARNSFPKELPSNDRSYQRKLLEIFVAQQIEKTHSKYKILELYMNRVYFGAGLYGVEAAARGYFGKPVKNLNLSECATLAGLLKSPQNLSPWINRQACIESRNFVLGRMGDLKYITPEQQRETVAENLPVKNRKSIHAESYALDLIRQQVVALVGFGSAISEGYRIYTTIDPDLQKKSEESVRRHLRDVEGRADYEHPTYSQYDALFKQRKKAADDSEGGSLAPPDYLQGALVALDNSNGAILALVGGRDFGHSQYDRAISAARPAGTAFGPLVYAAAFEKGLFPGTLFQDAVMDNRQVMIGGMTGILGEWGPERVDNKYEGLIPARDALVKSKNAATVRVGMQTGIDNVLALAKNAGINSELRRFPATYLGSSEVNLMDLTLAYTMFPNGGSRPAKPFIISRIEDKDGRIIFAAKPEKRKVIKDTTAFEVHSCLSESLERGTGDKAFSEYGLRKFPIAGKTGTAYNFTDAWFIGYHSAVTCGVWVGFDKPKPIYRGAFSNEIALPIWVDVMNSTFGSYQASELPMPRTLQKYEICRSSGLLATDKCFETSQDKSTGETNQRRTAYLEISTPEQCPKLSCTVHGTNNLQPMVAEAITVPQGQSQWPRASLAVNVDAVPTVAVKAPTVIGEEDPYNSVKPNTDPVAIKADSGVPMPPEPPKAQTAMGDSPAAAEQVVPEETEVRRAEPARPFDQPAQDTTIKLEAPPPLQF